VGPTRNKKPAEEGEKEREREGEEEREKDGEREAGRRRGARRI